MPAFKFIRETEHYWVIAEPSSKSNPNKTYEIRISKKVHRDHGINALYCNCMSCSMSYHKGDGKANCKHLREWMVKFPKGIDGLVEVELFSPKAYEDLKRNGVKVIRATIVQDDENFRR